MLSIERIGADLSCKFHVFERCQVRDQIVELKDKAHIGTTVLNKLRLAGGAHIAPVHHHGAGGRRVHAAQNVECRGFTGARSAQDNGKLATLNGKARAVERVNTGIALAIGFDNVFEFDIGHRLIPIWSDNS